jgi:hypothetical protein
MKKFLLVLAVGACFTTLAADTTRYVVLMSGKTAGKHLVWSEAPNQLSCLFEYNDRGRGPRLSINIQYDEQGFVTARTVRGVDYYKAPVEETFTQLNGKASWKNHIENEERAVNGKVLYAALNGAPGEVEFELMALASLPNHEGEVVPAGKARAVHVRNHTSKVFGFPLELQLYAFTGSGGPPQYVWFTPKKKFFATVNGWMSVVLEGNEKIVDDLKKAQGKVEQEYLVTQAKRFTEKQTAPVVFKNVNVFDAKAAKMHANQTVVVANGKITEVGKAGKVTEPDGARVIDGTGKTLMPGLWDNHAHYDAATGLYHLAGGVTNIKDMANGLDLPQVKAKIDNDLLLGPDISIMSGFIDFAGPYAGPTGKIVGTLEEGLEAVNYYADNGYQQIKLYSSIPPDWVKPLAERAHQRGLKVCGHVPSFMTAERAVKDGYDQIIHLNMIMLNFLGDTLDTRSMLRFIRVAERARTIDLKSPEVKKFMQLLREKKIVVDPTAAIFESMFTNQPGQLAKGYEGTIDMFPAAFRRSFYYGGLPSMAGHVGEYRESFENMVKMLRLLHENGITVVPGTDDFPGFTLHRELELYVQAGMTPAQVLQAATYTSAKVAGLDTELGSIEAGKKANLILVDGDPVADIHKIRRVELTMKHGNLYNPKALYDSYGFGFWK